MKWGISFRDKTFIGKMRADIINSPSRCRTACRLALNGEVRLKDMGLFSAANDIDGILEPLLSYIC